MAAVVLKREIEAYADAIDAYNRQARKYQSKANVHNASVDAYKAFIKQKIPEASSNNTYSLQGNQYPVLVPTENDPYGLRRISLEDIDKYYVEKVSEDENDNRYVVVPRQEGDMAPPGEFKVKPPSAPGNAPTPTLAQVKKLNQPSLTELERFGDKGLIGSAFNY
jgi:hypothetical protein